jgi:hypothetical protein
MRGFKRRKALVDSAKITFSLSKCNRFLIVSFHFLAESDPETDSLFGLNKRVGLNELTKETHFTAPELKSLYRSFKNTVPSALIPRGIFDFLLIQIQRFLDLFRSIFATAFWYFFHYVKSGKILIELDVSM